MDRRRNYRREMLNGRLYRAAFMPFAARPRGCRLLADGAFRDRCARRWRPDAFEGPRAFAELNSLAGEFPRPAPRQPRRRALAERVAQTLRALGGTAGGGFTVHIRRFEGQTIDGERELQSVIAQRPGSSAQRPIAIIAHRDAAGAGARPSSPGTAALLELARVFAARETQRTIVLVSTSGGSGGDAGARLRRRPWRARSTRRSCSATSPERRGAGRSSCPTPTPRARRRCSCSARSTTRSPERPAPTRARRAASASSPTWPSR